MVFLASSFEPKIWTKFYRFLMLSLGSLIKYPELIIWDDKDLYEPSEPEAQNCESFVARLGWHGMAC